MEAWGWDEKDIEAETWVLALEATAQKCAVSRM